MSFVLVTASRETSSISAVLEAEEWEKLRALAEALPNHLTWSAQPHDGAAHKSGGMPVQPPLGVDEHSVDPASPEPVGAA